MPHQASTFVRAAAKSEIGEGALVGIEVAGRHVALCCVGGVHYAFDDTCTHRGCLLSQGELEGTRVICPCHAGLFDVRTGEVLAGPPPEPVETYPVRYRDEDVEIQL